MAAIDIFGRPVESGDAVLTSDSVKGVLSAGGTSWVGVLLQNFQATYQVTNSPLYELGSNKTYRIVGRPEGAMQIGRILAVTGTLPIDQVLFDVCNGGGTMTIAVNPGTCSMSGGIFEGGGSMPTFTFGGLRATSYGISASADRLLVTESIGLTFNYLARR